MKNIEVKEFLINDYIYIPYINKEDINVNKDGLINKNDKLFNYLNKEIYSPVSGKIYGLSEINSTNGLSKVLIIENDFRDYIEEKTISYKDLYEIDKSMIKTITNIKEEVLVLKLKRSSTYDLRDAYILKDYISEILETLNIIEESYSNLKVKIALDKNDTVSYQTLFTYIGTYPNIEIEFKDNKINKYKELSIYDVIDLYLKLKNSINRDFIYLSVITKSNLHIIKTKKYSNLKEILNFLEIKESKIIINNTSSISSSNYLLDEGVYLVQVL